MLVLPVAVGALAAADIATIIIVVLMYMDFYCYVNGCTVALPRVRPKVPWPGRWTNKARNDKRPYIDILNARMDWQRWWAARGCPTLEIVIDLGDEDAGTVRRGKKGTKADFRLPLARLRHRSDATAAALAARI